MTENDEKYEFKWTPAPDMLLAIYDPITALVYGRVRRYCCMEKGYCDASRASIADWLGISVSAVQKALNVLRVDGYLKDLTPEWKNQPHRYVQTNKLGTESGPWHEKKMEEKAEKYQVEINEYRLSLATQGLAQTAENEPESENEPVSGSERTSEGVAMTLEDTIKDTNNIENKIKQESEKGKTFRSPHSSTLGRVEALFETKSKLDISSANAAGTTDGNSRLIDDGKDNGLDEDEVEEKNYGLSTKKWETVNQHLIIRKFNLHEFPSYADKRHFMQLEKRIDEEELELMILEAYSTAFTVEEALSNLHVLARKKANR